MFRFLTNVLCLSPDGGEGSGGAGGGSGDGQGQGDDGKGTQDDSGSQAGESTPPKKEGQPGVDEAGWDDKTKKYIEGLRKENARYRTDAKASKTQLDGFTDRFNKLEGGLKKALGIEDKDNVTLEDQVSGLTDVNQNLEFKLAIRDIADEAEISGKDAVSYFEYLVQQEVGKMKDDEEISKDRMSELVASVQAIHGNKSSGSTSVDGDGKGDGGHKPPPGEGNTDITLEEFVQMGTTKKGELFGKNPALYNSLNKQAREKKLI